MINYNTLQYVTIYIISTISISVTTWVLHMYDIEIYWNRISLNTLQYHRSGVINR